MGNSLRVRNALGHLEVSMGDCQNALWHPEINMGDSLRVRNALGHSDVSMGDFTLCQNA